MATPVTESMHADADGLETLPLHEAALLLAAGQADAAASVAASSAEIARASAAMARSIRDGGTLWYIAAGSSGLMAAADAMELRGTFGIPVRQIRILMAGGLPQSADMQGDVEDATEDLESDLGPMTGSDIAITVSASGTTPYTLAAARIASQKGAAVIGIANNADAPLLAAADHPILLATPPELLSGSTRMGAGTAQKIALNMLSTLMALQLGHVHDGHMVNLIADNAKLRARARGMVARIAGTDDTTAAAALDATDGAVKPAVLVARGVPPDEAHRRIDAARGHLRRALDMT